MQNIQTATETYLSQQDKLELSAMLGHGEIDTSAEDDQDDDAPPSRASLSPAEYARNLCAFDRNDAIRNGLHPAHVNAARRSLPVGWAW